MFGRGLNKKHFCKTVYKISAVNANFHFSLYKSMKNLSCHSNESAKAMAIKNVSFVDANVMNISAKFQLYPPLNMASEELIFLYFFHKFSLCVAMATNQIQRFGQKWYV